MFLEWKQLVPFFTHGNLISQVSSAVIPLDLSKVLVDVQTKSSYSLLETRSLDWKRIFLFEHLDLNLRNSMI